MATLADHLRALPDDGVAALLRLRPDLVVPVPSDLSALALRAQSRVSVTRALDPLDRFTLEILDALRLTRTDDVTSVDAVLPLVTGGRTPPEPDRVRAAIDRLRALFLVYGSPQALRVAAGVDEVTSPYPAGLGRPAADLDAEADALCADPSGLRRTVLAAPPAARAVLDRLSVGPPLGATSAAAVEDPDSPVGWLVSRHLLVPVTGAGGVPGSGGSVELPREIGLLLRRDIGPLGPLHPQPPAPEATGQSMKIVDSAGAGQVMAAVRNVEDLLDAIAAEPTPVLKSGGLGIRDVRRLAKTVGVDESATATLIETAAAAGLVGETDPDSGAEPRFLPTPGYDHWRNLPIASRWVHLIRSWLAMTRQPGLAGRRDERDRLLGVLAPELERIGAPALRTAALNVLSDADPGAALNPDQVLDVLAWRSPRRFGTATPARPAGPIGGDERRPATPTPSPTRDGVGWALTEAALLGLTGMGALTGYGRLLLTELSGAAGRDPDEDPLGLAGTQAPGSAAIAALDGLLPAPVDHVLLQADLTAVLPGPAEPELAAELALIGEPESTNVLRITAESLRRALDAGYTAAELHALFARRSRTPVPQGLTYLIDDVARRHGGLRVGSAGGYLRSDDEALLVELLADRRLSHLQLRRLAPTVLITPYASTRLLGGLREAGYSPVAEDASGAAVLARPKSPRAPARRAPAAIRSLGDGQVRLTQPRLASIVEQLRRADTAVRTARRPPAGLRAERTGTATPAQAHIQAMAVLQQAVRDKQRVWVGYVDAHGGTAARLVRPVSVGAGYLRAEDDRTETLHTFALHRITAAVVEE
ncbi:helicase-associated domain-containing protein [Rugosimonospora acidiphila]|uniref:Helicase-associated domain-containing protein n=1 Tax=Rugosimonospora acidiphila TaxID=556531 RepID=A0ABP9SNJ8_9ACTN